MWFYEQYFYVFLRIYKWMGCMVLSDEYSDNEAEDQFVRLKLTKI